MTTEERTALAWQTELEAELEDLRRNLLPLLVPGLVCISVAWFYCALLLGATKYPPVAPTLIVGLATVVGRPLCEKHYYAGCWVLLVGLTLAEAVIVSVHPSPMITAFGVAVIIAANAMLSRRGATLFALLAWALLSTARRTGPYGGLEQSGNYAVDTLILYLLTTGACWIASHPLRTSVEWSLTGWARAREALAEVRERRGELRRALRALEEATYRIERANNELVLAQSEAEEARAVKERFVATVSHELRSPLNLILGFARLMALSPESYGEALPRAYRADIDAVYRNTQHLASLVDDVLDLSQMEAQRLPLVKDRIDLVEDVVKKVTDIVRPLSERKGLHIRLESSGELPWVLADQVRLRQALLNLLTNAIRFTDRGGITIRTAIEEGCLVVSVQDTGRGIPAEDLPRIFQEFQMVHRTETREERGTGLGLTIAKHLVELHNGRIWVESQPGVGTTFYFTVPLPDRRSLTPPVVATAALSLGHTHDICLVVHDDPGIVRLLDRHFSGHRVVGVPPQSDIIALTEQLHPRAILTDPSLADRIHAELSHTPFDVPIVTCTLPHISETVELAGVVSYLVKPVRPEVLAAAMSQWDRDEEMTLLVVDDDPDAVRLIERMLTAIPHSHTILKAYDGLQALDIMKQVIPDVVLLDLVMPEPDGKQVIQHMRADERTRDVPVIVISALDWIDEAAAIGTPLAIRHRKPLEIARGTQYLQALLDAAHPSYLANPAASEPSGGAPLDQSASGAQGLRQVQTPDVAR